MEDSLFSRLYNKKEIEEDFITEAMAGVLKSLPLENLNELFDKLKFKSLKFTKPSIETQQITSSGRNDLVITDENLIIIFENKWNSQTDIKQLQRYDIELSKNEKPQKFLVHLTKDFKEDYGPFINIFKKINWSDLYYALATLNLPEKYQYLIKQFSFFLEERGIAMEKVSWEIINGSKAIYNLTQIIKRACQEMGYECSWSTSTGSLYTGQLIANKLSAYFLIDQSCLLFAGSKPQVNIPEMNIKWGSQYCIKFDFDKYYFFHRKLEGQVEAIKEFIKELLSKME